jgi:hypothetical protein
MGPKFASPFGQEKKERKEKEKLKKNLKISRLPPGNDR